LPGPFGIGDLGSEAYAFVDFLEAAGQSLWQVLPLGPTGYGDSPYACYSAFAGNTLLVSPERLVADGLLTKDALPNIPEFTNERVDFEAVHTYKDSILRKAFASFRRDPDPELHSAFTEFCRRHVSWLDDYALFRCVSGDEKLVLSHLPVSMACGFLIPHRLAQTNNFIETYQARW